MSGPDETSPLNQVKAGVEDVEQKGLKQVVKDAVKDVQEEGVDGYLGNLIPCRILAPISLAILQDNRKKILYIAHGLCGLAVVLAFLAFWGSRAWGNTLANLGWVTLHSAKGTAYAGVTFVCWDLPEAPPEGTFGDGTGAFGDGKGTWWRCETWHEFDCSKSPAGKAACDSCKTQAITIWFSVLMSVYSFYEFLKQTMQRFTGHDSNYTKFMACFAALIGGMNFLISMLTYWRSCVLSSQAVDIRILPGNGLRCMCIAAFVKVLMGLVHLGLPVEKPEKPEKSLA